MVYDRYRVDDNLVYEFKPLLILAQAVIRPDVSREDLLKVLNTMSFHYADPDSEDDEEANVLHYLARSGAAQYVRTKPEEETFNDLCEPSLDHVYRQIINNVLACQQDREGNLEGTDFNHQDIFGKTSLHYAIEYHEPILVEILLEKRLDAISWTTIAISPGTLITGTGRKSTRPLHALSTIRRRSS